MPAIYPPRRFAAQVLAACRNDEAREIIGAHAGLYEIGAQGPDLLFYYKPLSKNPVKAAGNAMHGEPAAPFFEQAAGKIAGAPLGEALLAYLLGFVCHFALDSECHSYNENEIAASGHDHISIETAFEAALMEKAGVDWKEENPAGYVAPSEKNARVIARVLPAEPAQLRAALACMKRYNRLLLPGRIPRKGRAVRAVLRRSGSWESLGGLLISALDRPAYAASSEELCRLFDGAVPLALELIDNYCAHVFEGVPLDERFGRTYGPDEAKMAAYGPAPKKE